MVGCIVQWLVVQDVNLLKQSLLNLTQLPSAVNILFAIVGCLAYHRTHHREILQRKKLLSFKTHFQTFCNPVHVIISYPWSVRVHDRDCARCCSTSASLWVCIVSWTSLCLSWHFYPHLQPVIFVSLLWFGSANTIQVNSENICPAYRLYWLLESLRVHS